MTEPQDNRNVLDHATPPRGEVKLPVLDYRTALRPKSLQPNTMAHRAVAFFTAGILFLSLAFALPRGLVTSAVVLSLVGFVATIMCSRIAIRRAAYGEMDGGGIANAMHRASVVLLLLVAIGAAGIALMDCSYGPAGSATRVTCSSHLRQIHQGIALYAQSNAGQLPPDLATVAADSEIGMQLSVFVCPGSEDTPTPAATKQAVAAAFGTGGHCSYRYLRPISTLTALTARHIVLYEPLSNHDGKGAHFVYGDGRAVWLDKAQAGKLIADLEAGKNPPGQ